jgi:hypothetical protein
MGLEEKYGCGKGIVLLAGVAGAVVFSVGGLVGATFGFIIGALIPLLMYGLFNLIKKLFNDKSSGTKRSSDGKGFRISIDNIISQVVVSSLVGITTYIVSEGDISITSISGVISFIILKGIGLTGD